MASRRTFEQKKADLLKAQVDIAVRRLDRCKARYMREREAVFASLSGEVLEAAMADPRAAVENRFVPVVTVASGDPSGLPLSFEDDGEITEV